jgi:hypothetical protein
MLRMQNEDSKLVIFFLYDDEDQSVRVEEVEEVSFFRINQHLDLGGSVFITHRRKPQRKISPRKESSRNQRGIQLLDRCSVEVY